jgi:large subunit ribosomal protein L30
MEEVVVKQETKAKKTDAAKKKKQAEKRIKVTLIKSTIGVLPQHIATVKALGLRKINSFNIIKDNAASRGMIEKVKHLVSVSEA